MAGGSSSIWCKHDEPYGRSRENPRERSTRRQFRAENSPPIASRQCTSRGAVSRLTISQEKEGHAGRRRSPRVCLSDRWPSGARRAYPTPQQLQACVLNRREGKLGSGFRWAAELIVGVMVACAISVQG